MVAGNHHDADTCLFGACHGLPNLGAERILHTDEAEQGERHYGLWPNRREMICASRERDDSQPLMRERGKSRFSVNAAVYRKGAAPSAPARCPAGGERRLP